MILLVVRILLLLIISGESSLEKNFLLNPSTMKTND
jgi:hypothetical protein